MFRYPFISGSTMTSSTDRPVQLET